MSLMCPILKFALPLLLLGLVPAFINSSPVKHEYGHCEKIVKKWAFTALREEFKDDKHTLQDLLFFLHVPRTGGRTYFHCFLRKLYSSDQECPRSYDKLRFDPRKSKCKLLVTHDDYSMMSKLPREKTSVVTILRNPVDRVFSAYEFSVEVAARFLVHPNITSATQMTGRVRNKTGGVSTLDIWPWKYLVPWMREDLFARRDARNTKARNVVKSSDPYNMEDMVMPLLEFIKEPVAHDIIHNGATFQIAGLTNNSYLAEAHDVRHCVQKYQDLGEYVLHVAKKRLDNMLYVGLTEDHRESATMFAHVVGSQVISQSLASKTAELANRSARRSLLTDSELDDNSQNGTTDPKEDEAASTENSDPKRENMTVEELMKSYEVCISGLRKAQSRRRINSLKRIAPANFTKEARRKVQEVVLQQIKSLNNLDIKLYEHAKQIFMKEHKSTMQRLVHMERIKSRGSYSYAITPLKLVIVSGTVILLTLTYVFVNARRRTSKMKI